MQNYVPDNNNNTLNTLLPTSRFLSPIYNNAHESSIDDTITNEHLQLTANGLNEDNLTSQTATLLNNSHQSSPLDTNCHQQLNYVDHLNEVKLEKPIIDELLINNKISSLNDNQQANKVKLEPHDSIRDSICSSEFF